VTQPARAVPERVTGIDLERTRDKDGGRGLAGWKGERWEQRAASSSSRDFALAILSSNPYSAQILLVHIYSLRALAIRRSLSSDITT
jgi:hypothetical protein